MADISFIKLHPNIEVAQDLSESPAANIRYNTQIQLLPHDPQPYLQVTSGDISLSFGLGYKIYAVKCSNKKEFEITDNVLLSQFGNQIQIKFVYLPMDFGPVPVYLKIDRFGNGVKNYYSNKFLITRYNEHLTSRIDYIDNQNKIPFSFSATSQQFQSIRLQFYFDTTVDSTEVETYYQITRSQTITPRISVKEYSKWKTQLFNTWTLSKLAKALYKGNCYINQTRNYIIEGLERAEREGQSNVSENEFLTDPDESDKINIAEMIISPEYETIPFLSSSSQLSSRGFFSSQSTISIPTP